MPLKVSRDGAMISRLMIVGSDSDNVSIIFDREFVLAFFSIRLATTDPCDRIVRVLVDCRCEVGDGFIMFI